MIISKIPAMRATVLGRMKDTLPLLAEEFTRKAAGGVFFAEQPPTMSRVCVVPSVRRLNPLKSVQMTTNRLFFSIA
jgi:hypothetical protein